MCTDYMGLVHYCRALIARQTRVKFQLVRSSSKRRRQVTCNYRTRSSGVKLAIKYARTSSYRHFYFNRIVHIYNAICSVITLSDSYYTIQCKVTDYLWSYFNSHFNPHNTCTFHLICPCNSCHASGLYI